MTLALNVLGKEYDFRDLDENNIKSLTPFCYCEHYLDITDATSASLVLTFDYKLLLSSVFVCNFEHVLLPAGLS